MQQKDSKSDMRRESTWGYIMLVKKLDGGDEIMVF